jgi:hypothetical protein
LTISSVERLAGKEHFVLTDVAHPFPSGVALAGSNPNCTPKSPKPGHGNPLRPVGGNCPTIWGVVAVGLVVVGLPAFGACGNAIATLARTRVPIICFIFEINLD